MQAKLSRWADAIFWGSVVVLSMLLLGATIARAQGAAPPLAFDFWAELGRQALPQLVVFVGGLVAALLAALKLGVREWLIAKVQSQAIRGWLERLNEAAFTVVLDLEQTMVPQIKAAAADGQISPEERQELIGLALAKIKERLGGAAGWDLLKRAMGWSEAAAIEAVASNIEAAVLASKGGADPQSASPRLSPVG